MAEGSGIVDVLLTVCIMILPKNERVNSYCNRTTASIHEDLMRGLIAEAFAGSMIQLFHNFRKCVSCVTVLKSIPFGKYLRSNPFVFSFVPRCQAEHGSAK